MKAPLYVSALAADLLSAGTSAQPAPSLPRPLALTGLHAYAEHSIRAGETIRFRVSSTVPYTLSICRLDLKVDDPAGDQVLRTFDQSPPVKQPIHPGSYVHVAKGLPADRALKALTLECWVRPWRLGGWQTLVCQYDFPTACGLGLFIDPKGKLGFYLGDGKAYRAELAHSAGPKLANPR